MSPFCTKSSNLPSNTPMSAFVLSALCTRRTKPSSLRMGSTQTMTRYTCPTCIDWEARGKKGNPYMRASRVCLRNLDFRLNSSPTRKSCKRSRGILERKTKMKLKTKMRLEPMDKWAPLMNLEEGQDEPLSTLYTTQKTRAREQIDIDMFRALLCLASKPVNWRYWTLDRQLEQLQEGRKGQAPTLCPRDRQTSRTGGVG